MTAKELIGSALEKASATFAELDEILHRVEYEILPSIDNNK